MGPKCYRKCPYKRGVEEDVTHTQRRSEAKEAAIRVTRLQVKKCQRPPEGGRGKGQVVPYSLWRQCSPVTTMISLHTDFGNSGLHNCERIKLCYFKPPSLCTFVIHP